MLIPGLFFTFLQRFNSSVLILAQKMAHVKEEMPTIPAENDVEIQPEAQPEAETLLQKLLQAHGVGLC